MSEQRISPRRRILKMGTIAFNGAGIDCVVRNISSDGAALEVESQAGIPSEFDLVISTEQFIGFCRVQWRKAKRLGVVFQSGSSANTMPPLAPALSPIRESTGDRTDDPAVGPSASSKSEDALPEYPGPSIVPDAPD